MTMLSVAAIGVGSMVGAGIFALLGQAVTAAGKQVYASFLAAGAIAILSGLSYARLAVRFPTNGGIVEYLAQAFPSPRVAGGLALLYFITLLATSAIVGKACGTYAARLLFEDGGGKLAIDLLSAAIVVLLAVINLADDRTVSRAEVMLVGFKLAVLVIVMAAGLPTIDVALIEQGRNVGVGELLSSIALTFFAYAGFGMMTNATANVADPGKTIPRAIFLGIGLVMVLYLSLAVVVLGNLPAEKLLKYADTAVAEVAKPILGHTGFVLVSIGAVVATASALNATLFTIFKLGTALSAGQADSNLAARLIGSRGGFVVLMAFVIGIIFTFDLSSIANVAGGAFLCAYLSVFVAHWRLMSEAGGSRLLIIVGAAMMLAVLAALVHQLWTQQPSALILLAALMAGCGVLASLMNKHGSGRPA
ncbi:APC family permease [Bradyrhizobium sp. USDA 4353]